MTEPSPEQERGPRRVYANDAVEVVWDPKLCIHVRNCVRGLPHVFDPARRPWVDVDAADADAIAATAATAGSASRPHAKAAERPTKDPDLESGFYEPVMAGNGTILARRRASLRRT